MLDSIKMVARGPSKSLKNMAKRHGVKLMVMRNGKKVYKSPAVLNEQIRNKRRAGVGMKSMVARRRSAVSLRRRLGGLRRRLRRRRRRVSRRVAPLLF